MIREMATLRAQKSRPYNRDGSKWPIETAKAKALMAWPEGKEKRSGGKSVAQQ
jgi:hypothetical protein